MKESYNTTAVRSDMIYVSYHIRKALDYIARATVPPADDYGHSNTMTREALAETILGEWINRNWPQVVEFLDRREREEKEFQKSITPMPKKVFHAKEVGGEPINAFKSETPT